MTADYLKQLNLPIYPTAIQFGNNRAQSMKSLVWIKSIAKIKKTTGLDVIIGFDIKPDPTNHTHNHIWLGPRRKTSLLYAFRINSLKHFDINAILNFSNSVVSDFETKSNDDDKIDIETEWISDIIDSDRPKVKNLPEIRRWIRKSLEFQSTLNDVCI